MTSSVCIIGWDTRTRTKNGRTRICSVTITPYPNDFMQEIQSRITVIFFASAKLLHLFETAKFLPRFFKEIITERYFWHIKTVFP